MQSITVAVLRGGPSSEYAVSLETGRGVLTALEEANFHTKDVTITQTGDWLVDGFHRQPEQVLQGVDVAFIALHGAYGEDGQVQRLLERFAVPYTGSRPYPSAIAMNKLMTKQLVERIGIKVPKHLLVKRESNGNPLDTAHAVTQLFGPQYVLKPLSGGSSIDTITATTVPELARAMKELLERHDEVLIEERIIGREATVGVVENYRGERLYRMPVVEIVPPAEKDFFDNEAKYNGTTEEICPGRFTRAEREALHELTDRVHTALELRHYSRSDFIITPEGPVFLEVNTLPGLTGESLFPKALEAVGGTYHELIEHLIKLARS